MNTRDLNKLEYPLEIDLPVAGSPGFQDNENWGDLALFQLPALSHVLTSLDKKFNSVLA